MIETLLRARGLRTGLFTSPHLTSMRERICVDGEPLERRAVRRRLREIEPYLELVDKNQPVPLSFFEVLTGDGVRGLRRCPGRRRGDRGRHGRHLGQHQRRRRRRRRGHARSRSITPSTWATRSPRSPPTRRASSSRVRWPSSRQQPVEAAAALLRRAAEVGATRRPGGHRVRGAQPRAGGRRPAARRSGACSATTTTCSCRCSARTRRATPPARSPRSRRSPARLLGTRSRPSPDAGGASRAEMPAELARPGRSMLAWSPGVRDDDLAGHGWRSSGAARWCSSTPRTTRPGWRRR